MVAILGKLHICITLGYFSAPLTPYDLKVKIYQCAVDWKKLSAPFYINSKQTTDFLYIRLMDGGIFILPEKKRRWGREFINGSFKSSTF